MLYAEWSDTLGGGAAGAALVAVIGAVAAALWKRHLARMEAGRLAHRSARENQAAALEDYRTLVADLRRRRESVERSEEMLKARVWQLAEHLQSCGRDLAALRGWAELVMGWLKTVQPELVARGHPLPPPPPAGESTIPESPTQEGAEEYRPPDG